ncbi:hypothetical protein [Kineococcus rhizosphaerae]|uniref:Uncharacterized protein n=1 Tax=Kineococcus rhizosphaerae TaxID=559628 RepID=A0A2T0R0K0_9ACTN|nr:hypothetical protein [Kineococcus rhizosphaerae]PRY12626.1 hypothetical protein CLV37_110189 [Kineococcus rhizosphaerae]
MIEDGTLLLTELARQRSSIDYSTFNDRVCDGALDLTNASHRNELAALLGDISRQSAREHDVMLTALVHLKGHRMDVGTGFYSLAQELGRLPVGANAELRSIRLGHEIEKVYTWAAHA